MEYFSILFFSTFLTIEIELNKKKIHLNNAFTLRMKKKKIHKW